MRECVRKEKCTFDKDILRSALKKKKQKGDPQLNFVIRRMLNLIF